MDKTIGDKNNNYKPNKVCIFGLILVLIFLLFNMAYSVYEFVDYQSRVQSGNDRWLQVEKRIVNIESQVNSLREEIDKWKN